MSIVKPKNFSYIRGPKGDKGDRGEPGTGVVIATGRITYNASIKSIGFNDTGLATELYVNTRINNLISGAPAVLDTLKEIADAINNDPNFYTSKLNLSGGTLTGALILNADPITNLGAATKQYVDAATLGITVNDTDDVPEGNDNLYYTTARANTDFDARLDTKTTSNVTEGTNLYYTTARTNTDFDTRLATKTTSNVTEGTNLYYTSTRANTDFDTRLSTKTTTNLTEGSNLYYTNTRARNAISVTGSGSYNASTGVITVTGGVTSVNTKVGDVTLNTTDISEGTNQYYTDTRARTAISATGNLNYNSGTGVMSYTEPGRSIDDLTDVDTSSSAPQDGESLIWDSGSNNWRPGQAAVNISTYNYDATAGQLIFTGQEENQQALSYTDYDFVQVFKNGILLRNNIQYTLNDSGYVDYEAMGDSIELTSPASLDDWIYIIVTNTTGSNPDFTTDGGAYADVMEPGLDGGSY